MKIAVVGAGITGCLLASFLDSVNIEISIFEKSRGCGGRASTKKTDWGQCDLGATIVPAQKENFINFMQDLCDQGIASKWPKDIFISQKNTDTILTLDNFISDSEHYIFNSKMNAACRLWIKNAHLHTNHLISQIRYLTGKGWQVKSNDVWQTELFDKIVLTTPWPQSDMLIEQSNLLIKRPDVLQSWTSCWSIGLKLNQLVAPAVDLVYLKDQSIQTLVRDSGKPLRPPVLTTEVGGKSEIWVAQLANELSDDLGKEGKDKAIAIATEKLCALFDLPDTSVSNTHAHYWRYARPSPRQIPLGILSQQNGVYVTGDWSFGASIESAYEAALTLSQTILTGE
ncbi:MAG: renalase [Flavobacteriales bacterium]|jgi:renalase